MPLTDCVKHNGKIYCMDKNTGEVTLNRMETVELKECPELVLKALIKMQKNRIVEIKDDALIDV